MVAKEAVGRSHGHPGARRLEACSSLVETQQEFVNGSRAVRADDGSRCGPERARQADGVRRVHRGVSPSLCSSLGRLRARMLRCAEILGASPYLLAPMCKIPACCIPSRVRIASLSATAISDMAPSMRICRLNPSVSSRAAICSCSRGSASARSRSASRCVAV